MNFFFFSPVETKVNAEASQCLACYYILKQIQYLSWLLQCYMYVYIHVAACAWYMHKPIISTIS